MSRVTQRLRSALAIWTVLAVALMTAGGASAQRSKVISASGIVVGTRSLDVGERLSAAAVTFGRPVTASTDLEVGPANCWVNWEDIWTMFHSAVGPTAACKPTADFVLTLASVTNAGWRTPRGLQIGDTLTRLRQLYPAARSDKPCFNSSPGEYPGGWWGLIRHHDPTGDPGNQTCALAATVEHNHVTSFRLAIVH
jgi:hypothetical protein